MPLPPDFVNELRKHFTGDIRNDRASRILYSADASIYQIAPLGVVLPRTQDDLQAAVELAAKYRLPMLPRGSGTSLAGQAIGEALIIDCSRWLDRILDLNAEAHSATVEPGVILSHLNAAASAYGLQYGPDPASAERATMGGVIANNATGAHSILHGMTADHLLAADVILADGSFATLGAEQLSVPEAVAVDGTLLSRFRHEALRIRERYADQIRARYPRTWRNSAGYRLNYLLPWSATVPARWGDTSYPPVKPGTINLSSLLAGSEGTLAVIRRATVNLVPKPAHTALGVLAFESAADACDAVPGLLEHDPSAVELIPRLILEQARRIPEYAAQMSWLPGDPAAILVVEFSGERNEALTEKARGLGPDVVLLASAAEQAQIWNVRRAGLGLLDSRPQPARPATFIEDCAIPVEQLGEFVRETERILAEHHTVGGMYAHASAGCLHIRPVLDLRQAEGVHSLRSIAEQVLALALRLGGAMASEHGDGLARGEWLGATYGDVLVQAMRGLKRAADPNGLLNPGKMFDAPPMDQNLRYGTAYSARPWAASLDFAANGGLAMAIEQCNGQGVCRKDTGVMCPSFQATRDEMHSTRGRANLLRLFITSGPKPLEHASEQEVFDALDLCLACKGCKAECPSGVDMAKLKFEFLDRYYAHHARAVRDYVFGYFHVTARVLSALAPIVNLGSSIRPVRSLMARALRISPERPFPRFAAERPQTFRQGGERVFLLSDAFTHYVDRHVEQAAGDLLGRLGFEVLSLRTMAAAAALLSKGFLEAARAQAGRLLNELAIADPHAAIPIVGLEPSELYAFRHEYTDLLPGRADEIEQRALKAWSLEEFIVRSEKIGHLRVATTDKHLLFHPHCHQKAEESRADGFPMGPAASFELLRLVGYEVEQSAAGCCGMAGTFGYEAEHYTLSQQVGELRLFPRLRELSEAVVAATGAACRMQIAQATGVRAEHPAVLALEALWAEGNHNSEF